MASTSRLSLFSLGNLTRSILQGIGSEKIGLLAFHGSWAIVQHVKTTIKFTFEEVTFVNSVSNIYFASNTRMSEQNLRLDGHQAMKRSSSPCIEHDHLMLLFLSIFRLSQHSKNLFFDLGSATIQNLKYRDVWVLVGQKGITGFSPYEEVCC